jgi:5-methyltetrahydropteroyltriglutamate--homocysteine methyltransferase
MYLCTYAGGNYEDPRNHDMPLQDIIGLVFQAPIGGISFEAADPPHPHEWQVFTRVAVRHCCLA